jgi:hypothetical protein
VAFAAGQLSWYFIVLKSNISRQWNIVSDTWEELQTWLCAMIDSEPHQLQAYTDF